jgi:hypothetical protein
MKSWGKTCRKWPLKPKKTNRTPAPATESAKGLRCRRKLSHRNPRFKGASPQSAICNTKPVTSAAPPAATSGALIMGTTQTQAEAMVITSRVRGCVRRLTLAEEKLVILCPSREVNRNFPFQLACAQRYRAFLTCQTLALRIFAVNLHRERSDNLQVQRFGSQFRLHPVSRVRPSWAGAAGASR